MFWTNSANVFLNDFPKLTLRGLSHELIFFGIPQNICPKNFSKTSEKTLVKEFFFSRVGHCKLVALQKTGSIIGIKKRDP